VRSDAVIYRNGKAHVATNIGGHVAFAPLSNMGIDTTNAIHTQVASTLPLDFAPLADHNGDGIPDLEALLNPPAPQSQLLQDVVQLGVVSNARDLSTWQGTSPIYPDAQTPDGWIRALTQDLNGDGTRDVYFEEAPSGTTSNLQSFISFLGRGTAGYDQTLYFFSSVGGPTGSPQTHPRRRWIDVNGDGLPDLYEGQVD